MAVLNYLLLLVLLDAVLADCNCVENIGPGSNYDLLSPKYPDNYEGDANCTWILETDEGYNLKLSCDNFKLPQSSSCSEDHVTVSPTGDNQLSDGQTYCGDTGPSVTSQNNKLTIALTSTHETEGGAFSCNITSVPSNSGCNCGWKKQNRIVGGVETGINEYPMMAVLRLKKNSDQFCGGSVISSYYVLTAAHCVHELRKNQFFVTVGAHNLASESDTSTSKSYQVAEIKAHPDYDTDFYYNDIALVKVDGPISTNEGVLPVCLPFQYTDRDFTGEEVTMAGWGRTEEDGRPSNVLLKINVKVAPLDKCKSDFAENVFDSVTSDHICTYAPGKDSCQGDSGGPVLWYDNSTGRDYQIGVNSYGLGCKSRIASVNARVTSYLDWIISNTSDDYICRVA